MKSIADCCFIGIELTGLPILLLLLLLFESKEAPKLALVFTEVDKEKLKARRNEVLKSKGVSATAQEGIGSYSYDELQKIFGKDDLDVIITRDESGVRLQVGKSAEEKEK